MSAKIVILIETNEHRGLGNAVSPHRLVPQFYTLAGKLVVEHDEFEFDRLQKMRVEFYDLKQARDTLEIEFRELAKKFHAAEASRVNLEGILRDTIISRAALTADLNYARRHGFRKLALKHRKARKKSQNLK